MKKAAKGADARAAQLRIIYQEAKIQSTNLRSLRRDSGTVVGNVRDHRRKAKDVLASCPKTVENSYYLLEGVRTVAAKAATTMSSQTPLPPALPEADQEKVPA